MTIGINKIKPDGKTKFMLLASLAGITVVAVSQSFSGGTLGPVIPAQSQQTVVEQTNHSCAITLDSNVLSSFRIASNASVEPMGCGVLSASNLEGGGEGYLHPTSMPDDSPTHRSNGGLNNAAQEHSFDTEDKTGDPMKNVQQPAVGPCNHRNLTLKSGKHVLKPGVYCGGIVSLARSQIKMEPGIYVMKDGPFHLSGGAALVGHKVGIYLQGVESVFGFGATTSLKLTAPEDGPMAGILVFEDRSAPFNREFIIRSFDARTLEGLIYLPKGRLIVDNGSKIGHQSKWTSIIAHQIDVRDGSEVRLNSNYSASPIPMPTKTRPTGDLAQASQETL